MAGLRNFIKRLWLASVIIGILAVLFGQIVRDRFVLASVCMFVPPIAVAAVAWVTAIAFRAKWRVQLFAIAFLIASIYPMLGFRRVMPVPSTSTSIRIVQWNVLWGGIRGENSWPIIEKELIDTKSDLIFLSEAPNSERVEALLAKLGPPWNSARLHHLPTERYTSHLVVASCYKVNLEDTIITPDARMLLCSVEVPNHPLCVLLVDGLSTPTILRTARLQKVKSLAEDLAKQGRRIDVIAGDFNSPGCCIAFDDFKTMAGGYERASDYVQGWRGTWPSVLPLLDIDHVWVQKSHAITGAKMINTMQSDHRGEIIDLSLHEVVR